MRAGKVDLHDPCRMLVHDMYKDPKTFLLCRGGRRFQNKNKSGDLRLFPHRAAPPLARTLLGRRWGL